MENSSSYLVKKIAEELVARDLKVVVAESCTGGGLAKTMTSISGSSRWFERGYVTYSNDSKKDLLRVLNETLEIYGAVSVETALEMAEGAINNSLAQVSVAVTGIAGPDGGTVDKPVGTVCFAWSMIDTNSVTTSTEFSGDREAIREQAILMAIQGLLNIIEKN